MVRRGEVWLVRFDPTVGSEIRKTRPAVILSPGLMNDHLHTVIVAPLTTGSRPAGFRQPLAFDGKDGLIVLDHLRSIDKKRLVRRLGELDASSLADSLSIVRDIFTE